MKDYYLEGEEKFGFFTTSFYNTLIVEGNNLVGVEKSIPTIEYIIITRILMFNTVYFHKTCRIAQKMLGYAYLENNEKNSDDMKL